MNVAGDQPCFPLQHTYCLAHKTFPCCSSCISSLDLTCLQWDSGVSLALFQAVEARRVAGSTGRWYSRAPLTPPNSCKGYSHHCMVIVPIAPGLFAPTFLLRLTTHDKPNRTKPNPDFLKRSSAWKQALSGHAAPNWYTPTHYDFLFVDSSPFFPFYF